MKILIIDNNIDRDCWGSQDLVRLAASDAAHTVHVRRAPHQDLPKNPSPFDRIIISGSKTSALEDAPWIDLLLEFIRKVIKQRKPYLGICYGHQALVRAIGGKDSVRKGQTPEFGWTSIQIEQPSSLFRGLPRSFFSFSAHFEEVGKLPAGMTSLAHSKDCGIHACQLESLPIFGIQFHPEKNQTEAETILKERKKLKTPAQLLNASRTQELYNPEIGKTIFRNFLGVHHES